MQTLLLATRNAHKTREFSELLGSTVRDLTSYPDAPQIAETGATFDENAALKAVAVSQIWPDEWVIADDSGLEVDALGGAPGIYSARYAGADASDASNVSKLLQELHGTEERAARFVCVIALARKGDTVRIFRATTEGAIAPEPRGTAGFGYDPVFVPNGAMLTFAEMSAEEKNRISHRAKAVRQLRDFLRATGGT